jgi:FtsH-binding integral membrane protein
MRPVLLYHADAEVDNALAIAIPIALVAVCIFSVGLIAIAPRNPTRHRRATGVAVVLAGSGLAALAVLLAIPWFTADETPTLAWSILALFVVTGFFLAPLSAFVAFFREEGRVAGAAIGLSLVLPALLVAFMVACGVTDACFH